MLAYIIFFTVLGLIIAFGLGVNLSSNIDDPVLYFLFWMMFVITIGTLINIGLTGYYYDVMKKKSGPRGPRGERGETGDPGEVGQCDPECRTNMCNNSILEHIIAKVALEEAKDGVPVEDRLTMANFKNVFIKERLKTQCSSPEYSQLAPYKGEQNLINYLKTIWGDIAKRIYQNGGAAYFKSDGAENSWDWVNDNPWNEFKKYDVYYWGLGKEYRPQMVEKCDTPGVRSSRARNDDNNKWPNTLNMLGLSTNNQYLPPSKRDAKYSILSYINVPNTINRGSQEGTDSVSTWVEVKDKNNSITGVKMFNANSFQPSPEVMEQVAAEAKRRGKSGNLPGLKPLSYLIAKPGNPELCARSTNSGISYRRCNPYDPNQIYQIQFTGAPNSRMQEFHIQNASNKRYLGVNNSRFINKTTSKTSGEIFTFN